MFVAKVSEVREEGRPALSGRARGKMARVKGCSDPHVVHEQREADHHAADSHCTAKFTFTAVVNTMIFGLL